MDDEYFYSGIEEMQEYSKDLGTAYRLMEGYMRQGDKKSYMRYKREAANILDKMRNKMYFIADDESSFWEGADNE